MNNNNLDAASPRPKPTEDDIELLSLIVHDAANGLDIKERYPTFYRQMQANKDLQELFDEVLDEVLYDRFVETLTPRYGNQTTVTIPPIPTPSIETIQSKQANFSVNWKKQGQWQLTWKQTVAQLAQVFRLTPGSYALGMRDDVQLYEDDSYSLIYGEVSIAKTLYDVFLEAKHPLEFHDELHITLTVTITSQLSQPETPDILKASLTWGTYEATITVTPNIQTNFPEVMFLSVYDEEKNIFVGDLSLVIEVA